MTPIAPSHGITTAALIGESILRALAGGACYASHLDIADAAGRPAKNIKRELGQLATAGLITEDNLLTGAGEAALVALDRAARATAAAGEALLRVPYGALKPNPMNPAKRQDDAGIDGLADTILEAQDVLEPLIVSPPDADGLRTIWAGERRWRAVRRLAASGDLPGRLKAGLPCVEREADEGQALFIAVVENSQREDMSPWEDAVALRDLQDKTGWSARELAMRVGRAHEGSEAGVRDVQVKIKIAREASVEAVAEYTRTGSWDGLRATVQTGAPTRAPGRVETPEASDPGAMQDAATDPQGPASAPPPAAVAATPAPEVEADTPVVLSAGQRLLLIELAHACHHAPGRTTPDATGGAYAAAGKYWLDANAAALQQLRLIDFKHSGRPYARVSPAGWAWLASDGAGHVTDARLANEQALMVATPADFTLVYATDWLNPQPEPQAAPAGDAAAQDAGGEGAEPSPEDEAAQDLLDRANELATQTDLLPIGPRYAALLEATGAPAPWREGEPGVAYAANGACALVVDVDNQLHNDAARARTIAVIMAVNAMAATAPGRVETPPASDPAATPESRA